MNLYPVTEFVEGRFKYKERSLSIPEDPVGIGTTGVGFCLLLIPCLLQFVEM